jgi:hypothetical protein
MLNPRVGEIVSMGSPLMRFRIVVLPALSSPLIDQGVVVYMGLQHKQSHFLFLLTQLFQYRQQSHREV